MNISKVKAVLALLTGGIEGIIKYLLDTFNTQVLAKIPNKETAVKYMKDAQAVYTLISAIMEIHKDDLSEQKKAALEATLSAIDELTKALEDFNVSEDELNAIIDKVHTAIDAWKAAK